MLLCCDHLQQRLLVVYMLSHQKVSAGSALNLSIGGLPKTVVICWNIKMVPTQWIPASRFVHPQLISYTHNLWPVYQYGNKRNQSQDRRDTTQPGMSTIVKHVLGEVGQLWLSASCLMVWFPTYINKSPKLRRLFVWWVQHINGMSLSCCHCFFQIIWIWWVVSTLWKILVSWDDFPNIWKVIKFMFQTTNQESYDQKDSVNKTHLSENRVPRGTSKSMAFISIKRPFRGIYW